MYGRGLYDGYIGVKVKLSADLTRYHPSLKPGVIGEIIGQYGKWSCGFEDRFIGVRFPEHTLDVLWTSFEIIKDDTYKRLVAEKRIYVQENKI